MHALLTHGRRVGALLAAIAVVALSAAPVFAQLGDPAGPGQPVPQPPAQCPRTVACSYQERSFLPDGYRFQALEVCGANCSVQYWVSDIAAGKLLLAIEPVRGGGLIAAGQPASSGDTHPPVRTILPDYAPTDPACCPSGYRDTTYTWDGKAGALIESGTTVIPADSFGGWDSARAMLQGEGFFEVFRGL